MIDAAAEKAAHAAEHARAMRELANGDMWLRLFTARVKNATDTSPFGRRYDAILDRSMARLDAAREAEGRG